MQITIKYGVESAVKDVASGTTFGQIRQNAEYKAFFGWGDNINLLVNGVAMPDNAQVPPGAVISVETAANQKA